MAGLPDAKEIQTLPVTVGGKDTTIKFTVEKGDEGDTVMIMPRDKNHLEMLSSRDVQDELEGQLAQSVPGLRREKLTVGVRGPRNVRKGGG